MIQAEAALHRQVCDYLRLRYPNVLYRTDFAAGMKMTVSQAIRHKRLQSGRAWPDLFIAEPRRGHHGLFIELKASNIFKRDGSLRAGEHILEQSLVLAQLNRLGYKAQFACGFDQARKAIDDYLL